MLCAGRLRLPRVRAIAPASAVPGYSRSTASSVISGTLANAWDSRQTCCAAVVTLGNVSSPVRPRPSRTLAVLSLIASQLPSPVHFGLSPLVHHFQSSARGVGSLHGRQTAAKYSSGDHDATFQETVPSSCGIDYSDGTGFPSRMSPRFCLGCRRTPTRAFEHAQCACA